MTDPAPAPACTADHCITCGDDGIPMTIVGHDAEPGISLCSDDAGELWPVETTLVDHVLPGDRVLVHAGVAIAALAGGGCE